MLKTRAWVEICSLVLKPDFFIPCFPNLKEKSYLFLCVKVQCFKCIGAIIINGGFSGGGGGLVCFLIVTFSYAFQMVLPIKSRAGGDFIDLVKVRLFSSRLLIPVIHQRG